MRTNGHWSGRIGGVLMALSTAVVLLVLFVPSVFSSPLTRAGLIPHPDRYTALYFTDPRVVFVPPTKPRRIVFAFTVENHEAGTRIYRYRVTAGASNLGGVQVAAGALRVASGRAARQVVQVGQDVDGRTWPHGRVRVRVSLTGTPDAISFWTSG